MRKQYKADYGHEGIEREEVKTTKGVRWTSEELREYVKNFSLEDVLRGAKND